jgi:hypothetical protein
MQAGTVLMPTDGVVVRPQDMHSVVTQQIASSVQTTIPEGVKLEEEVAAVPASPITAPSVRSAGSVETPVHDRVEACLASYDPRLAVVWSGLKRKASPRVRRIEMAQNEIKRIDRIFRGDAVEAARVFQHPIMRREQHDLLSSVVQQEKLRHKNMIEACSLKEKILLNIRHVLINVADAVEARQMPCSELVRSKIVFQVQELIESAREKIRLSSTGRGN